ncbi:hypothetical protein HP532_07225 [Pseudomonas sp. CrR25]|nr:hypothetical protein [Pseudomonas sp. CrR25]
MSAGLTHSVGGISVEMLSKQRPVRAWPLWLVSPQHLIKSMSADQRLGFTGELAQCFEAALLFLQQALLTFADQIEIARRLGGRSGNWGAGENQPYGQRNTTKHHAFNPLNSNDRLHNGGRALKHMAPCH